MNTATLVAACIVVLLLAAKAFDAWATRHFDKRPMEDQWQSHRRHFAAEYDEMLEREAAKKKIWLDLADKLRSKR